MFHFSSDYSANIQLKLEGAGASQQTRIIAENSVKFFSDGSSSTFKVYFNQPVQIEPEVYYTASAILDGSELSYFGQDGVAEITCDDVTFRYIALTITDTDENLVPSRFSREMNLETPTN